MDEIKRLLRELHECNYNVYCSEYNSDDTVSLIEAEKLGLVVRVWSLTKKGKTVATKAAPDSI